MSQMQNSVERGLAGIDYNTPTGDCSLLRGPYTWNEHDVLTAISQDEARGSGGTRQNEAKNDPH